MYTLILLCVVFNLSFICCQSGCNDFETCGDCISYAKERCVWCAQNTMNASKPVRCLSQTEVLKDSKYDADWCPSPQVYNPNSKEPIIEINKSFSSETGKEIQLRPQKIKLKLRPGVPVSLQMSYQPAKDYPLDLYFLMDNSFTMKKHADELAKQTKSIYYALSNLTNNVRLGLGTFVEKPALPYSDPRFQHTYAFKHHLSLTNDTNQFEKEVESYSKNVGSNWDSPEAGLDALMQVMTCFDQIGWRNDSGGAQSLKNLVLATDSTYHSAGDGKMAGAYQLNDMKCHLDNNIYDTKISQRMDYPSVSQIRYMANKNDIMIVFVVLKRVLAIYETLAKDIPKAAAVEFQDDKIVKMMVDSYMNASREVTIVPTKVPSMIKITPNGDSYCGPCLSTLEKPQVDITARVQATGCNKNKSAPLTFDMKIFGLSDKLTVEVDIDCECNCEKGNITIASRDNACNMAGFKSCGICKCDTNRSGENCEIKCSSKDILEYMDRCKEHPEDNTYCNDRGSCQCGKCTCNNLADYSGEFCQHNDAECRKHCPADKGDCRLGECICRDVSLWTGPNCNCPVSNDTCIGPFSKQPCSGRGTCQCGKCICYPKDGKGYFGSTCESCPDCAKDLCEQLKEYAICSYSGQPKADCDSRYTNTSVNTVIIMNKAEFENETSATACRKKLDDKNFLLYKFNVAKNVDTEKPELEMTIQKELEKPPIANIWVPVASVIGGVILVGLLTLIIWKVVTNIYDKREYDKFCQEATKQGYDVVNPVYLNPTVNFVNPSFGSQTN